VPTASLACAINMGGIVGGEGRVEGGGRGFGSMHADGCPCRVLDGRAAS